MGAKSTKVAGPMSPKGMGQHGEPEDGDLRLFLLGTGESGKATMFTQLQMMFSGGKGDRIVPHPQGVIDSHRQTYTSECMFQHISGTLRDIVSSMPQFGLHWTDPASEALARYLSDDNECPVMAKGRAPWAAKFRQFWSKEKEVCAEVLKRLPPTPHEWTDYTIANLDRIATPEWIPTATDMLNIRVRTTGVIDTDLHWAQRTVTVRLTGGQRNERLKWIRWSDPATIIVFVVATDCYQHVMFEDYKYNRMQDVLECFTSVVSDKMLGEGRRTLVVFNKIDRYVDTFDEEQFLKVFPDYSASRWQENVKDLAEAVRIPRGVLQIIANYAGQYESALEYLRGRFLKIAAGHAKVRFHELQANQYGTLKNFPEVILAPW